MKQRIDVQLPTELITNARKLSDDALALDNAVIRNELLFGGNAEKDALIEIGNRLGIASATEEGIPTSELINKINKN